MDLGALFIIVGLPILLYAALRGYQMYMTHQQYEAIIEERRLLLERGVPVEQLPPLQMPEAPILLGKAKPAPVEAPPRVVEAAPRVVTVAKKSNSAAEIILSLVLIILGVLMIATGQQPYSNASQLVPFGVMILLIGIYLLIRALINISGKKPIKVEYTAQPDGSPTEPITITLRPEGVVQSSKPVRERRSWRAEDPFLFLKAGFIMLGVAGGIAAMGLWGDWTGNDKSLFLTGALFPAALGAAFLVLQLFLSIADHRLALVKGVVYLVLLAICCWLFPVLYQPQLPWVEQVRRIGAAPLAIAVALFIDFIISHLLEPRKPVQRDHEETIVMSRDER